MISNVSLNSLHLFGPFMRFLLSCSFHKKACETIFFHFSIFHFERFAFVGEINVRLSSVLAICRNAWIDCLNPYFLSIFFEFGFEWCFVTKCVCGTDASVAFNLCIIDEKSQENNVQLQPKFSTNRKQLIFH